MLAVLGVIIISALLIQSVAAIISPRLVLPMLILGQGLVVLAALRVMLARRAERWADIGLRPFRFEDAGRAVLALLSCFAANLVFSVLMQLIQPGILEQHARRLERLVAQLDLALPFAGLVGAVVFVAVYEELVARGFLLARCRAALPGTWPPILVSSVLFGLGHVYQGGIGFAQTTMVGIVLALFTLRWGTLWPAILAHAAMDLVSITVLRSAPGITG